jgi:hypothetical protein
MADGHQSKTGNKARKKFTFTKAGKKKKSKKKGGK